MQITDTEYNIHSDVLLIGGTSYVIHLWLSPDYTSGTNEYDDEDFDPDLYQLTLRKVVGNKAGPAAVFSKGPREGEAVSVGLTYGHLNRQGGLDGSVALFKEKLQEFIVERNGAPVEDVETLLAGMENEELKSVIRFVKGYEG